MQLKAARDGSHKASPLLGEQRNGSHDIPERSVSWSPKQHLEKWWTIYVCAVFIIVVDVPSFMSEGPKLRMLELAACL